MTVQEELGGPVGVSPVAPGGDWLLAAGGADAAEHHWKRGLGGFLLVPEARLIKKQQLEKAERGDEMAESAILLISSGVCSLVSQPDRQKPDVCGRTKLLFLPAWLLVPGGRS